MHDVTCILCCIQIPPTSVLKVKVEDLQARRCREEEFPVRTMEQLQSRLTSMAKTNKRKHLILLRGHHRCIEVWSGDGKELLERYTPVAEAVDAPARLP